MKKNMGKVDRMIRLLIAVAASLLVGFGVITGTVATIIVIGAAIFLFTSVLSFCPLYVIFGINTCKKG